MKIAFITDDGETISPAFGRAQFYRVFDVEDGKPSQDELRQKPTHSHAMGAEHSAHEAAPHGFGADEHNRHISMIEPIRDCQVLIAGGMGAGAYQDLTGENIETIITDVGAIQDALQAYLQGTLVNQPQRLH